MKLIKNGVATDSITLTIVRVITALISILISKLLTVNFSVEEYGIYSQAMLIATTGTSITILGLTDAVNYFFNKEKDDTKKSAYLATIFCVQMIFGSLFAIICLIFSNQIALYFNNADIVRIIPLVAFLPIFNNIMNMLQILFVSAGASKALAMRNLVLSVAKVIYVFIICTWLKNITYILICLLLVEILTTAYMWFFVKKRIIKIEISRFEFRYISLILGYSIPMAGYIVTNSLSRSMDKLVIARMGDTASLAVYSVASKELPFDLLTAAFVTVLIPFITRFISNGDNKSASNAFSKYIQLSYMITWPIGIGAIVSSRELMCFLYDEKYLAGNWIFVIYIIVDMIRFANVSLVFSAKAKTKELLMYSGIALVANLILNISFYSMFGMIGPAIATIIVMVIINTIMLFRSSKLLKSNILNIINWKLMVSLLVEMLVWFIITYTISKKFFISFNLIVRLMITFGLFVIPIIAINFKNIWNLLKDLNSIKK